MKTQIWLDLEGTIIRSVYNHTFINVDKLLSILNFFDATQIGIFSFAIIHPKDQREFNEVLKDKIEKMLNVEIVSAPTTYDMMNADYRYTGYVWDKNSEVDDFKNCRQKMGAFELYIRSGYNDNVRAILVDDVVANETITDHDNNIVIEYINVDFGTLDRFK